MNRASLRRILASEKMILASDDFATWVLNTTAEVPLETDEVIEFCRSLGMKIKTQRPKRTGPRWQTGDRVCVKAEKHKGAGKDAYSLWDREVGFVTDAGPSSVTVDFNGTKVELLDAQRPQGVGLSKATDWSEFNGHGPVEIVYLTDPSSEPLPEQVQIRAEYLARGKSARSLNYYSGFLSSATNAPNGFYMKLMAQQRISQDPCSEFYGFRSFNPEKGKVLYIGRLGKRPGGWQGELDALRAEVLTQ